MAEETNIEIAKRKAEEKAGFFTHLFIFLGVNALLAGINIVNSPNYLWFFAPLIGWGIGLLFHFLGVFVFDTVYQNYIKKQTKKELDKLEKAI